jgi:hypothetical protein
VAALVVAAAAASVVALAGRLHLVVASAAAAAALGDHPYFLHVWLATRVTIVLCETCQHSVCICVVGACR